MPVSFEIIRSGKRYSRHELARIWGYSGYQALARGVVTPRNINKIILFVTKDKQGPQEQYADKLAGNILHWEGPTDHFAEERIIEAEKSGDEVHVFYRGRHHMGFMYLGQAKLLLFSKNVSKPSKFEFGLHQKEASVFSKGKEKTIDHVFQKIARMEIDLDAISNHLDSDLENKGAETGAFDLVENQGLICKKKDLATRTEFSKTSLDSVVSEKCMWLGITKLNEVAIFEVLESNPEVLGEIGNVVELAVKRINPHMQIEEEKSVFASAYGLLDRNFINLINRSSKKLIFPNRVFWDRQITELQAETLLIHELLLKFFVTPLYESAFVIEVCKLMQLFYGFNTKKESSIFHLRALCRKDELNSIKLFSSSNESGEEKHLVLWNGDSQTLSEKIRDIRKRIATEKFRTNSKSGDFEPIPEKPRKTISAINTSTKLSVKQKIENILREATTPLHYKEVEEKVFEKYCRRHATNGILNNSPNIVRVLSGIFVHKENFSHDFQKEFEGEKAAVIKLVKNKVNTDTNPLAIDDFSKELHKSGNFHRLNEKSIVAVVAAVRQISPDFRIIPQPGNPKGRCIVHKSYCQQSSKKPIEQIGTVQSWMNLSKSPKRRTPVTPKRSNVLPRLT